MIGITYIWFNQITEMSIYQIVYAFIVLKNYGQIYNKEYNNHQKIKSEKTITLNMSLNLSWGTKHCCYIPFHNYLPFISEHINWKKKGNNKTDTKKEKKLKMLFRQFVSYIFVRYTYMYWPSDKSSNILFKLFTCIFLFEP